MEPSPYAPKNNCPRRLMAERRLVLKTSHEANLTLIAYTLQVVLLALTLGYCWWLAQRGIQIAVEKGDLTLKQASSAHIALCWGYVGYLLCPFSSCPYPTRCRSLVHDLGSEFEVSCVRLW
jgi:hypothetical protein